VEDVMKSQALETTLGDLIVASTDAAARSIPDERTVYAFPDEIAIQEKEKARVPSHREDDRSITHYRASWSQDCH
jgi:hypothetical protein